MKLRTCVSPEGRFVFGVHRPRFTAANFRGSSGPADLGSFPDGTRHRNASNFPNGPVHEPSADWIFEIPNAFPFRGTTYIGKTWADARAGDPASICLPAAPEISFFDQHADEGAAAEAIRSLPRPLQLALAVTSTDARDLCCLAHIACQFCLEKEDGSPRGLAFVKRPDGKIKAAVADEALFEAVANNRYLPDDYKRAMVLAPGVQGTSEIVGDYSTPATHMYEYLRRNSYIPWGHYAANMADDAVRYRVQDLRLADMTGMRHLYYQRTYARLAELLELTAAEGRRLNDDDLEVLRREIVSALQKVATLPFDRTLWGWNYGFDYAPSGYRLHASHQQIHQQFAMIPKEMPLASGDGRLASYACGDLVGDFVKTFRKETGKGFFECYQAAILNNQRMDGNDAGTRDLVVFEDDQVLLFVPKAQTSQWELQIMPKSPVGNIVEADPSMRASLNRAIFTAVRLLGAMGARMITSIEYSKPVVGGSADQRLLIALLPKLPESPGAFSEAQLRWINGHYPEDFSRACRSHLPLGDEK
jgi:hypothetical protein